MCVTGTRGQSTHTYHRRYESVEEVDVVSSDEAGLWLEFDGLRTTQHCHTATLGEQRRRPRLVVYLRGNNSVGKASFAVFRVFRL